MMRYIDAKTAYSFTELQIHKNYDDQDTFTVNITSAMSARAQGSETDPADDPSASPSLPLIRLGSWGL